MWYIMANVQQSYSLSERLIRAISQWQVLSIDEEVEDLLNEGADVNQCHGMLLPLHVACMVADSDTARLLLERGAQVNAVDGYGRTAIHYAAEKDLVCLNLLMANDATVDAPDNNHDTPLHWACYKNNWQCVRSLLQNGARVDVYDYNNDTPLSWAALKGNLESLKVLLEYNARVDTANYEGSTPLCRASRILATGLNSDQDDASLELLLKAHGQVRLEDERGRVPAWITADNKLNDILLPCCSNVRPLQGLCRFVVRRCLGQRYLPNVVPKLPIPGRLQEFILLQT